MAPTRRAGWVPARRFWMEAGRAFAQPGSARDPDEPKDRSACRWVCACLGTPRSCDPTPTGGRWWRPRELVRRLTSAIPYPAWERPTASAARAKPRIGISPRRSRACSIPIERTALLAASLIFGTRVALAGPSRYSIRQLAAPSAPGGRGSHATAAVAASSARLIYAGSIVIPARRSKA